MSTKGGGGGGGGAVPLGSSPKEDPKREHEMVADGTSVVMHLSMLSRGEGRRAGLAILIKHSSPREWLLTLWIRPRVRIFDFSLSLPGVEKF